MLDQKSPSTRQGKGQGLAAQRQQGGHVTPAAMAGSVADPAWPWAPRNAAQGCGLGRFYFLLSLQ